MPVKISKDGLAHAGCRNTHEMDPLVTIAITSYNYGRHVGEAIRSALAQTYRNLEILVLDNASTDDSLEVIRSFDDERIRLIARPENIGIQKNHNDAIRQCRGEYIVFLSADDMHLPTLVEDMMTFRRLNPQVDVVYGSAIIMDARGKMLYYFDHGSFDGAESYEGRNEFANLLVRDSCMYLPTILFPRAVFDELGLLDEELEIVLDYEYAIRMAGAGKRFAFTAKPGALIRFHGENRSGVKNFVKTGKQLREFGTILERYTQPKYHRQLAGWRTELDKMLDLKIAEIGQAFPDDYRRMLSDLQPYVDRARASIAKVPDIGQDVLDGNGLISVIIPFNGRVGPLQRALESLAAQTYGRWEAIVVCDSAADPSGVVRWMGLGDRARVARLRNPHGVSAARNLGIGCARGEILCYLDDDNRFDPGYLQSIAQAFADPNVHVTVARTRLVLMLANGDRLKAVETDCGLDPGGVLSLVSDKLPINAVAHRRSCLARAGRFGYSLPVLEGWEFLIRMSRAFAFTPVDATCEVCVDVHLQGHFLLGRRDSAGWNEYAGRVQAIYNAVPVRSQDETARRGAYAAALQGIIQKGVNSAGNVDGVAEFALSLMGARETAVVRA